MMDAQREFEIRQEARFVLWALRCAVSRSRGDFEAEAEIAWGFQMADVLDTSVEFWNFADVLCSIGWSLAAWHDPRCGCISTEEIVMLQALAETAERQRRQQLEPAAWWRTLVPNNTVTSIDAQARCWLNALDRAGVKFPGQGELVTGLRQLENLVEPAGAMRLH
jgi:hypothetical protein